MDQHGSFKKENPDKTYDPGVPENMLFQSFSRYNEYINLFISLQQSGDYAPISAYEKPDGEIVGLIYMIGEDKSYSLSTEDVIIKLESTLEKRLEDRSIISYTLYYHSRFANDGNHEPAATDDELKAITIAYNFGEGSKSKIGLPYILEENGVAYQGFQVFSPEENKIIFNTQSIAGKEYFQERIEIKAPVRINDYGITISKSNTYNLTNTWSGIFGFEYYRQPGGTRALNDYITMVINKEAEYGENNIGIKQIEYVDLIFKVVILDDEARTIMPVIKTDRIFEVENKAINEWENVDDLEATISGGAKDTFGLWYFATDYAENKNLYQSQKKLRVKISGILFVLDIYKPTDSDQDLQFSEDFTAFIPNNDLPNYGCFDFIGELVDFRETRILEDQSFPAYIITVRLLTNPEIHDFFTIDMYITPGNMRFTELTKGMKLTGMFQMQGRICHE